MNEINFNKQAEEIGINLNSLIGLYNLFVEQTEKNIIELNSFILERDSDNMRDMAHHIKGACLYLEVNEMAEISVQMQIKANDGNWNELPILLIEFTDLLDDLKNTLNKVEHE